MDRKIWADYRAAEGREKTRLRDKLIVDNEALAKYYVREFEKRSSYYTENIHEDLLQAARIGMIRALDAWKPDEGGFSSVAFWWAIHEMQLVTRHASGVSVPKSAFMPRKKQDEIARFVALHGREPAPEEVGLTEKVLDRARKANVAMAPESDADEIPSEPDDFEGAIDRKRDLAALKEFVNTLGKKDQKEFWTGDRSDLTEQAKQFVEGRRICRTK